MEQIKGHWGNDPEPWKPPLLLTYQVCTEIRDTSELKIEYGVWMVWNQANIIPTMHLMRWTCPSSCWQHTSCVCTFMQVPAESLLARRGMTYIQLQWIIHDIAETWCDTYSVLIYAVFLLMQALSVALKKIAFYCFCTSKRSMIPGFLRIKKSKLNYPHLWGPKKHSGYWIQVF